MQRYLPAAVLILTLAARASAQTGSPLVTDLADAAAVVVTGQVTGVTVQSEGGAIYTYATVAVGEVLKGDVTDEAVVVKQLGGTLPGLGLFIAGQAAFARDEAVLLFLGVVVVILVLYFDSLSTNALYAAASMSALTALGSASLILIIHASP